MEKIPDDEKAEKAVLGSILVEPDLIAKIIGILKPEHFYTEQNQRIFRTFLELGSEGIPIDLITACDKLPPNYATYMSHLMDGIPKMSNISHYAGIVVEKFVLRQQLNAATALASYLSTGGCDPQFAFREFEKISSTSALARANTRHAAEVVDGLLEEAHQKQEGLIKGEFYSTGTRTLDKYFRYEREKLYIIGGRPAMGKTSFALGQAIGLCRQGISGILFEQEMSDKEIGVRMASAISRVPFSSVRDVTPEAPLSPAEWNRLSASYDVIKNEVDLEICDIPSRSIEDVHAEIVRSNSVRVAEGQDKLGFVVFDYLQIANLAGSNRVQSIAHFTCSLKNLAREYGLVAILLSQLSRPEKTSFSKEGVPPLPQLSDLRDSGAIEQDADLVAFIHRPEYYLATTGHPVGDWQGVAQVAISKQRGGATGIEKLDWTGDIMTFSDSFNWSEQDANC